MKALITTLSFIFFWLQSMAQCLPPTPAVLPPGWNEVTIDLPIPFGVVYYYAEYKLSTDNVWIPLALGMVAPTAVTLPNLLPATQYDFQIQSICSSDSSTFATLSFSTTVQPCNQITNLSAATNSNTSATLNWTAPVNSAVAQYKIIYKAATSSIWLSDSTSANSITLNGLSPSTLYYAHVKTFCTNSDSSTYYTSTQFSTACLPPDFLYYTPAVFTSTSNPNGIKISWNPKPNALTYTYTYSQDLSYTSSWSGNATISDTTINFLTVPSLSTYTVSVRSNCASGHTSAYKTTLFFNDCWAPTLYSNPTINATTAYFGWIPMTGSSYTAEYKEEGGNWITAPMPTTWSPNFRSLTGLTPGANHIFRVRRNCTPPYTSYDTEYPFTTLCPTTSGVLVPITSISTYSATAVWTAVSGVKYKVLYSSNPSAPSPIWFVAADSTTLNTVPLNGLTPNTTYTVAVLSKCTTGNWINPVHTSFTSKCLLPSAPSAINGPSGVCGGQTSVQFGVDSIPNVTSYIWTLPSGATGASTSNIITLNFSSAYLTGNICVTAVNACGQSTMRCRSIVRYLAIPGVPGTISGTSSGVCPGTTKIYSITPVLNATSYIWNPPFNASIASGQGTAMVTVNFSSNFGNGGPGQLSVKSVNCYGNSAERNLRIRKTPAAPLSIAGPNQVCQDGTSIPYSTANNPVFTYEWDVIGGTITSGQYTNSILVTWGTVSGKVKVRANVSCASSSYFEKAITAISCDRMMQEQTEETPFEVYPNPVHESAHVKFNSTEADTYSLMVYDLTGKRIIKKEGMANEGMNIVELPTQQMKTGIYIIKYSDAKGNYYQSKLQKQQ